MTVKFIASPFSYMDDLWYDFSGHIYKYFLGLEIFTNQIDRYFPFFLFEKILLQKNNGFLLPKLFWPTVRKNCSSDREILLKFKAEGQEFLKILRPLEQFIQTVKGQNSVW